MIHVEMLYLLVSPRRMINRKQSLRSAPRQQKDTLLFYDLIGMEPKVIIYPGKKCIRGETKAGKRAQDVLSGVMSFRTSFYSASVR